LAAPRILFPSVKEAHRHTPFFIDEDGLGIWLSTDRTDLPPGLPVIYLSRNAVHIPSVDQAGRPLPDVLIASFLESARRIGLNETHAARGYWTLSGSGRLQVEHVWIASGSEGVKPADIHALALDILQRGNQDAVACEIAGDVQLVSENVA